ncbi:MAG: DUF262 domain-containing protein [Deltaproteobacteria bacterium]|nr:DUF262 domain-containing protein [Deltaproteobacteria bacterium]
MEARNRYVPDWFNRIRTGQVRLPRFQRLESWTHSEVTSLLESVLRGLPGGAALVLEVGDREQFISRPMPGAPKPIERASEHLLDGQQRLTALWRSLHDLYDDRSYFAFVDEEKAEDEEREPRVVCGIGRWTRNGQRYPMWTDSPVEQYGRGLVPFRLLQPGDLGKQITAWCDEATKGDLGLSRDLMARVFSLKEHVTNFNIPFLSLPVETPPHVAIKVFVKLNTTSVELTPFDILVAQGEATTGQSLRDLEADLRRRAPTLADYMEPGDLLLSVAAFRQDRPPTEASFFRLDLKRVFEEWNELAIGVEGALSFLEEERVFDKQRLPTVMVVSVISALWSLMPRSLDEHGQGRTLLRKYLWRSFLTRRYENAASTRALQDFRGLRSILRKEATETSVPVFDETEYPPPTLEELKSASWPKGRDILARGILAVSLRGGGHDLADDRPATRDSVKKREYHHLFPDSLLMDDGKLAESESSRALNCVLITWHTNRKIAAKEPLDYLRERIDKATLGEPEIRWRLKTHAAPFDSLNVGGYADELHAVVRAQNIKTDYEAFLEKRAELVGQAIATLWRGEARLP